jgi:hypothetical protein
MIEFIGFLLIVLFTAFLYFNNVQTQHYVSDEVFIAHYVKAKKLECLKANNVDISQFLNDDTMKESKGEKECRRIMQKLFQKEFTRVRPDFLLNKATNRRLELDCYNEELKIALEYNGAHQHYNDRDQINRDKMKKDLCKQNGVTLISVPYTVPFNELEKYILYKLEKKNCLSKIPTVNYDQPIQMITTESKTADNDKDFLPLEPVGNEDEIDKDEDTIIPL